MVSSWGIVVGWRGQNEWKREMTLLQNAAVQKTLCAVKGSCGRKANAIAAVENMETFAKAASGRFLARNLCNPLRAAVGQVDEGLGGEGTLSLVGHCWQAEIHVIDLGPCGTSTSTV